MTPRPLRYRVLCQDTECQQPATMRTTWRTPAMPAPAFYYSCTAHQWREDRHPLPAQFKMTPIEDQP